MPTQTRILVAIGLGYVTWAICHTFMDPVGATATSVVLGACVFALTKRYPQD